MSDDSLEVFARAMSDRERVQAVGFKVNEFDEFIAEGLSVKLYKVGDERGLDILLPGGGVSPTALVSAPIRRVPPRRPWPGCRCRSADHTPAASAG